tara:strand:- start:194 stop:343 length:150 start_codon:yes stop_codon:yes gene_type:complete
VEVEVAKITQKMMVVLVDQVVEQHMLITLVLQKVMELLVKEMMAEYHLY